MRRFFQVVWQNSAASVRPSRRDRLAKDFLLVAEFEPDQDDHDTL